MTTIQSTVYLAFTRRSVFGRTIRILDPKLHPAKGLHGDTPSLLPQRMQFKIAKTRIQTPNGPIPRAHTK